MKKRNTIKIILIILFWVVMTISLFSMLISIWAVQDLSSGSSYIGYGIVINDINGDNKDDIIINCGNMQEGASVQAFNGKGELIQKYGPIEKDYSIHQTVIEDLNGDKKNDVVVVCNKLYFDGRVYYYDNNGHLNWIYKSKSELEEGIVSDLNHDDKNEIIIAGPEDITALDTNGEVIWILESNLTYWNVRMIETGDIDGDEIDEILLTTQRMQYIINNNGEIVWNSDVIMEDLHIYKYGDMNVHSLLYTEKNNIMQLFLNGTSKELFHFEMDLIGWFYFIDIDQDNDKELIIHSWNETIRKSEFDYIYKYSNGNFTLFKQIYKIPNEICYGRGWAYKDFNNDGELDLLHWTHYDSLILYLNCTEKSWENKVDNRGIGDIAICDVNT